MARHIETVSTHGDGDKAAGKAMVKLAALLTKQGKGKTHFVKVNKTQGVYRVDLYER